MQYKFETREKQIVQGLLSMARRGAITAKDKVNTKLADRLLNKFDTKSDTISMKVKEFKIILLMMEDTVKGANLEDSKGRRNIEVEDEATLKKAIKRLT